MNKAFKLLLAFAAVLSVALLYFFVDARNANNILPKCIFYSVTGFYCPGCGSQRALSAIVHGNIISAVHYNFLMVLCLPLVFYSAVVFVLNVFRKKQIVQKIFYSTTFVRIFFVAVIVFWVIRNIPVYPFNLLAPHE